MTLTVIDNIEYNSDLLAQKNYQSSGITGGIDCYTKLLIHADGQNGSQSFIDSSINNRSISVYGNTRILSATPPLIYGNVVLSTSKYKFGTSSAYFDGNGDYLGIIDSEDWNFGTGDFTIECWYNPSTLTGSNQWRGLVCQRYTWTSNHAWSLQLDQNNGGFGFCWSLNGSTGYGTPAFGGPLTIGQWYHVCVSRIGDQLYCACNGNVTVFTGTASAYYNSTAIVAIGRLDSGGSGDICGYIDEVRISKGIARYTFNFTPPVSPYESDSYTKLLMHMEGQNNSIGFTIDSWSFTKFSSYAFFDGSGDYLRCSDSDDFALENQDFTIDCWIWLINGGHGSVWSRIIETLNYPNIGGIAITTYNNENPTRIQCCLSDGTNLITSDSTIANDSWHHIALVRYDSILKLYIDGISQSTQPTVSNYFTARPISIGSNLTGGENFLGYIDEFRFSKGIARWISNFNTPTEPYSHISHSLLAYSESGIIQEGSYSLKSIASQTSSLNNFLIYNFSSPKLLSSPNNIVGKIRSSRSGSNIKISFYNYSSFIKNGSVSTNSQYSPDYQAAYGCDNNESSRWQTGYITLPGWWKYDLGSGVTRTLKKIKIIKSFIPNGAMKDFIIQASNDDSIYDTLLTSQLDNVQAQQEFEINNSNAYRFYKIVINNNWQSSPYVGFNEVYMYEDINGNYIDITPNITEANVWKAFNLDVSSLESKQKDSIKKIIVSIINADEDNIFYIDNIFATNQYSEGLKVSKIIAYAVIKPPIALNVSKIIAYAVIQPYINQGFGHIDPQLGSDLNNGSSWHNAWRTITNGPTSSRITSGNCLIKIAKSEDPVSIGQAQWCNSLADTTDRELQNDYYTQFLLKFDEPHGTTYTIDSSWDIRPLTCNNLLITNAQSKLNPTSGYFNGSSTYISTPTIDFLNVRTDDWTVDFWFMGTGTPSGTYPVILSTQGGWNNGAMKITWDEVGADRRIGFSYYTGGSGYGFYASSALNFNQWYHVALIRRKDYLYFYIDGVLTNSYYCGTSVSFDWCYGGNLRIGGNNWDTTNSYFLGYLSELRISIKTARWLTNFTPPTQPYVYKRHYYDIMNLPCVITQTPHTKIIDRCDENWTASTDITTSASQTVRCEGYASLSIIIGANFTTGKIAYKTLPTTLDLSSFQKISFFYLSSANHGSNIFKICLCSDSIGDTIVNTFILPSIGDMGIAGSAFFPLTIDSGSLLGSNINSIAIYAISDPGTLTLYFDNIIACEPGNSLSLTSLVSKNSSAIDGEEPWCVPTFIFDNVIYVSSYYGSNETVETYQRQTYRVETSTDNYVQVSGSNGNIIKFQGGYNKSTDQVDGETFYRGRYSTIGFHTNSKSNISVKSLNILSAGTGLYVSNSLNCDINIKNLILSAYPGSNSLYLNTSHNNKINIKHLYYLYPRINISDSSNNIINLKNHNLNIIHSGYNNKIFASQNIDPNLIQHNVFSNSKLYIQDFETQNSFDLTITSSTDNTKIFNTRLYREDNQNIITKYVGETSSQTNIRHTQTGLAWKLYLSQTVNKLAPIKLSILKLAVEEYKIITVSCYFYRDSLLISGALVCERWQLNGIDSDAIAYTTSDSLNAWEQLTINFSPTQTGVVDIKVYAFGDATYSVYVDDISYNQVS